MIAWLQKLGVSALLVALAILTGCASVVPAPVVSSAANYPVAESWARVLAARVDEQGRVDFDGVARDRADLDRFVAWIYETGPNNQPQLFPGTNDVLAYHLNAYNALALYNVIAAGIPTALATFGERYDFFYRRKLRVGGEDISLYDYENRVIRALGEERVHFALNCMAVSCPRLPQKPFNAATLEQDLARETRLFFSEARNFAVDDAARTVRLSEILKFYPDDFLAKAASLAAYAGRHAGRAVPEHYSVTFTPYDWTINRQPTK